MFGFVFSIFLLLILAGLTGCKDDGTEFLEKELVAGRKYGSIWNGLQSRKNRRIRKVKYPGRNLQRMRQIYHRSKQ